MRYRQIQIDGKWELVPIDEDSAPQVHAVFGDVQPYKSQITGEWIDGRKQHRDHLKRHNCVEVGNDIPKSQASKPDTRLKEMIARQVYSKLRY